MWPNGVIKIESKIAPRMETWVSYHLNDAVENIGLPVCKSLWRPIKKLWSTVSRAIAELREQHQLNIHQQLPLNVIICGP